MSYTLLAFTCFINMSSIPSSTVPNSVTSFTAFYAHKRAVRSAHTIASKQPSQTHQTQQTICKGCNGTQEMSINMSIIGDSSQPTITKIKCVHCTNGHVNPIKELYNSLVWCRCKHRNISGFIHAQDGVRVFGKTTYLCSSCGFVKQFG